MRNRLNSQGQREGKVINYKFVVPSLPPWPIPALWPTPATLVAPPRGLLAAAAHVMLPALCPFSSAPCAPLALRPLPGPGSTPTSPCPCTSGPWRAGTPGLQPPCACTSGPRISTSACAVRCDTQGQRAAHHSDPGEPLRKGEEVQPEECCSTCAAPSLAFPSLRSLLPSAWRSFLCLPPGAGSSIRNPLGE